MRFGWSLDQSSWILRDGFSEIVIASASEICALTAEEAAAAIRRAAAKGIEPQPGWAGRSQADIETGLERGDLIALRVRSSTGITPAEIAFFEAQRQRESVPAPPSPIRHPKPEVPLHQYRVRVIDDTGAPVAGVRIKFEIEDTPRMQVTDANGVATVEWFSTSAASVHLLDIPQLRERLEPQWAKRVAEALPTGSEVHRMKLSEDAEPLRLTVDTLSTVILCRDEKHTFEIVVYDMFGRIMDGVDLTLTIDGANRNLTTDEEGRIVYEGASERTATARIANVDKVREMLVSRVATRSAAPVQKAGADALSVVVGNDAPVISLESDKVTKIVLRRKVLRVRLVGMLFDHAKCFLLPSALEGIRKVSAVYADHPEANLLVVGHTDTRHLQSSADQGARFNRRLSLERARSVAAYLKNEVEAWCTWYSVDDERGWGTPEDMYMLSSVPPGQAPYYHEGDNYTAAVKNYQANKALPTTGTVAERTRHALVADYMSADGTTLPEQATITCHGCGPHFPEVPSGPNEDVPQNRRVEIFVFDGPILPPPPADYSDAGSPEYAAWVAQVAETIDFGNSAVTRRTRIRLCDDELNPHAKKRFILEVDGCLPMEGETDASGVAVVDIPEAASTGTIRLFPWADRCDRFISQQLTFEPLSAASTPSGASARLQNLNYYYGGVVDRMTDELCAALRCFQADWDGLKATGGLDPDTASRLQAVHEEYE